MRRLRVSKKQRSTRGESDASQSDKVRRAKADLLIVNIGQLATPRGRKPATGEKMSSLRLVRDAAVAIKDESIAAAGPQEKVGREYLGEKELDAGGRLVTPGFVDPHTHMVFAGSREREFEMRCQGASYKEIALAGGGILSTVRATREASEEEILRQSLPRLSRCLEFGTTTVEIKSGYGLDTPTELKMLRVIDRLRRETPLDIVSTLLGAHEVPPEYRTDREGYVQLLIEQMIPAVAESGLAEFADIFTEQHVFDIGQSRRILKAAKEAGFKLKLHADEIVALGGAELAAELKAISADHLGAISRKGIKALAESGAVAVLLPGTTFFINLDKYAPAAEFKEAGVPIALSTDCNPGSSMTESMQIIQTLACLYMGLTPAEALTASTLNAACAIDRAEKVGTLEPGKQADMVIWDCSDYRAIAYHYGVNLARTVVKKGKVVAGSANPGREEF
jgi:imidazolonepropionase